MIAVDYFLYDNRTQSQWGRDWGIKAATGMLENRGDLKAEFSRYCGAMLSQRGSLSGFGAAIGGLRSRMAGGYLLCVTLESRDLAGRPSWAVFGLWSPDSKTLETIITADPIASTRAVLGAEAPPSVLHVQPATTTIRAIRRRALKQTAFHRFDPDASAREVLSLLLGAIRARTALPNILGITASARLPDLARVGFDRVYSHPMDETTSRILARVVTGPEPEIEDDPPPRAQPVSKKPLPQRGAIVQPRSASIVVWPLWLAAGIGIALAVALLTSYIPRESGDASLLVNPTSSQPGTVARVEPQPSAGLVLLDIETSLRELKRLEPDALRRSKGYQAAREPVLETWARERKEILDAYATLLDVRERMIGKDQVAYYYEGDGAGTPDAPKLEKIRARLEAHSLGSRECKTLRYAFAFEFEDERSTVSQWCASLTRLESAIRAER